MLAPFFYQKQSAIAAPPRYYRPLSAAAVSYIKKMHKNKPNTHAKVLTMSILNKKLKSFKRGNGMAVPALLFLILEIKSYTNKKVPANFNLIKIMPEFAFTSSFEWKIFFSLYSLKKAYI